MLHDIVSLEKLITTAFAVERKPSNYSLEKVNNYLNSMDETTANIIVDRAVNDMPINGLASVYNMSSFDIQKEIHEGLRLIRVASKFNWFPEGFVLEKEHPVEALQLVEEVVLKLLRTNIRTVEELTNNTFADLTRILGDVDALIVASRLHRHGMDLKIKGSNINLEILLNSGTITQISNVCKERERTQGAISQCKGCPYVNVGTSKCMFKSLPSSW